MYPYNYQQSILPGGGYHCVSDILVYSAMSVLIIAHCVIDIYSNYNVLTTVSLTLGSFWSASQLHDHKFGFLFSKFSALMIKS